MILQGMYSWLDGKTEKKGGKEKSVIARLRKIFAPRKTKVYLGRPLDNFSFIQIEEGMMVDINGVKELCQEDSRGWFFEK